MKRPLYSWVFPCYNEAQSLAQLVAQIQRAMRGVRYEIIAVDDGSQDTTSRVLRSAATRTPPLRMITLPTRQGKWVALGTGIAHARADRVITLDSDLQDDPGEVNELLKKLDEGYDVVSGWRRPRHDPAYKVWISALGNRLISRLTRRTWHDLNAPFKVYRREVLAQIPTHGSLLRFSLLFAHNLSFRVAEVPIRHRPRQFGTSKFGLVKYLRMGNQKILAQIHEKGVSSWICTNSTKYPRKQKSGHAFDILSLARTSTARCVKPVMSTPRESATGVVGVVSGFLFFPTRGLLTSGSHTNNSG